eukprot:jgi/Chlat1/63/Chrsp1S03030
MVSGDQRFDFGAMAEAGANGHKPHTLRAVSAPGLQRTKSVNSGNRVLANAAVVDLKNRVLQALTRLNDRDTKRSAAGELRDIIEAAGADTMPNVLSCLYEVDSTQKPPARREVILLYSEIARVHGQGITSHTSKIVTSIVKRFKDPDAAVRAACAEALGSIMQYSGPRDTSSMAASVVFYRPLFEALSEQNKEVQIAAASSLAAVISHSQCSYDGSLSKICQRMVRLLHSAIFQAEAQLLQAVQCLAEKCRDSLTPFIGQFVPVLAEKAKHADWNVRKAAVEALSAIAKTNGARFGPHWQEVLDALELCRFDKVKPVRDAVAEAHPVVRGVEGSPLRNNDAQELATEKSSRSSNLRLQQKNTNFFQSWAQSPSSPTEHVEVLLPSSPRSDARSESEHAQDGDAQEHGRLQAETSSSSFASAEEAAAPLSNGSPSTPESHARFSGVEQFSRYEASEGHDLPEQHTPDSSQGSIHNAGELSTPMHAAAVAGNGDALLHERLEHIEEQQQRMIKMLSDLPPAMAALTDRVSRLETTVAGLQSARSQRSSYSSPLSASLDISFDERPLQHSRRYSENDAALPSTSAPYEVECNKPTRPGLRRSWVGQFPPTPPTSASTIIKGSVTTRSTPAPASSHSWSDIMEHLAASRLNEAYTIVAETKDDFQLVRLIGRTGPILHQLSIDVAVEIVTALVQLTRQSSFVESILPWFAQLCDMQPEVLPAHVKQDVLGTLHSLAELHSDAGKQADQLVGRLLAHWQ